MSDNKIENIVNRNIDELIFAEYNPRQLTDDQYKHLKDSITRFGIVDPIIVNINEDRKDIIVGGHQRVKVARIMGIEKIPCVEIDLTYDQEKELNVRLNKNTGEWDLDILANVFELDDLLEWGFDKTDLKLNADVEIKDISDSLNEQYEVVVECSGEKEQEEVFNKITEMGYKCRILTL